MYHSTVFCYELSDRNMKNEKLWMQVYLSLVLKLYDARALPTAYWNTELLNTRRYFNKLHFAFEWMHFFFALPCDYLFQCVLLVEHLPTSRSWHNTFAHIAVDIATSSLLCLHQRALSSLKCSRWTQFCVKKKEERQTFFSCDTKQGVPLE